MHYSSDTPKDHRRVRSRCGIWSLLVTSDPDRVTCGSCKRLLALDKARTMTISNILPLTLLILAACGPALPDDDTSGSTSTSDSSTSDASTGDTSGVESSGESSGGGGGSISTGDEVSTSGEGAGGSSGAQEDWGACLGEPCAFAPCRDDLSCLAHPVTGLPVCVALCGAGGVCDAEECGTGEPLECVPSDLGVGFCFPK